MSMYEGPASEAPSVGSGSGADPTAPVDMIGATDENEVQDELDEVNLLAAATTAIKQLVAAEAEELAEGEGSTGPVAILLQVLDLLDCFACMDDAEDAASLLSAVQDAAAGRSRQGRTEVRFQAPSLAVRSVDHAVTEIRAAEDGTGDIMTGHFAVFNQWTEINSRFEGQFMERIAPSAFNDTIAKRAKQVRVLYDHGADPQIGNKPLGEIIEMRADKTGVAYKVRLFDASYVNDLKPALRAGQLGASFRMRVVADDVTHPTRSTNDNPNMLPERTITAIELYEFGPVTFPAYDGATAGLRSRTDWFVDDLLTDPVFVARFAERVGPKVAERLIASTRTDGAGDTQPTPKRADGGKTVTPNNRYRLFALANGLTA